MSLREGYIAAAEDLAAPYPEDLFTPLTDAELTAIRDHLSDCPIRFPMERMHAEWARHWARVLHRQINEAEEEEKDTLVIPRERERIQTQRDVALSALHRIAYAKWADVGSVQAFAKEAYAEIRGREGAW